MLKIIVAINNKNVIGLDGKMPWHVPEDLKHFRNTTLNQKLIMGRVTYENLPKTLDKREIYLVSKKLKGENVITDLEKFLIDEENSSNLYFICGGAQIYKQAIPYTSEIILSRIDNDIDGDTYFPLTYLDEFELIDSEVKDTFTIERYQRKGK